MTPIPPTAPSATRCARRGGRKGPVGGSTLGVVSLLGSAAPDGCLEGAESGPVAHHRTPIVSELSSTGSTSRRRSTARSRMSSARETPSHRATASVSFREKSRSPDSRRDAALGPI